METYRYTNIHRYKEADEKKLLSQCNDILHQHQENISYVHINNKNNSNNNKTNNIIKLIILLRTFYYHYYYYFFILLL